MYEELLELLLDYSNKTAKGGFSGLELFVAKQKNDGQFDHNAFDEILARLVTIDQIHDENIALGIATISEKTGCFGPLLRDELERLLFNSDRQLTCRSQFELANLFVRCGGDLSPQRLDELEEVKAESPELWLDLALQAYPDDVNGLTNAVVSMVQADPTPLLWQSLKPRYLKLIDVVSSRRFNKFAVDIATALPSVDCPNFLAWINRKRGSKLSLSPQEAETPAVANILAQDDLEFLTAPSCLANPISGIQRSKAA